jgi:hypothetical protein
VTVPSADGPAGPPAGARYVALGSSFAAGPGIPPVSGRAARRSGRNYVHQVSQALSLRLTDVTFSGATTAHILSVPQRAWPGHVPAQIEAVTADTALVTITAGGNDVGYIGGLMAASLANVLAQRLGGLSPRLADRIRSRVDVPTTPGRFSGAAAALGDVADEIRRRSPRARILLVDYLTVVGSHEHGGEPGSGLLPLGPAQAEHVAETAAALASAFADAAQRSGAELVRASAASLDHGVCAPQPWVTGFAWGNPLVGLRVPYHPNLAGMTAVARLVIGQLRGDQPEGGG